MAWKAECNRRKWYCILGWDAVSWFSEYSYNEWRRSLTPAQIRKLEEYEKKQKEKREKEEKGKEMKRWERRERIQKKRGMSELLTPRMGSVDEKDTR